MQPAALVARVDRSRAWVLFDWLLVPSVVVALAFEPNFAHGFINYSESGQYLGAIDELLRGGVLYRDAFAQYGPLQYWIPAGLFASFGPSLSVLRGVLHAGEILSLVSAAALCRVVISSRALATFTALWLVVDGHHPFWSSRWGSVRFAFLHLSLLALVVALRARRRRRAALVVSGLLAGLGFLHSPEVGVVALAATGAVLLLEGPGRARAPAVVSYALGWALAGVFGVLMLIALGGSPAVLSFAAQLTTLGVARAWLQPFGIEQLSSAVVAPGVMLAFSFAWIAWRLQRGERARVLPLAAVSSAGLLLYAAAFRAIRGPQLEAAVPLAVVAGGFLLGECAAVLRRSGNAWRPARWGAREILAALLLVLGLQTALLGTKRAYAGRLGAWWDYQLHKRERLPRHAGSDPLGPDARVIDVRGAGASRVPDWQASEIEQVVHYIETNTDEDEAIFGYPDLGLFAYFADRPHLTRFSVPVLAAARVDWSAEVLATLEREPPAIVLRSSELSTLARATRRDAEYLPAVRELLKQRYRPVARFGRIVVHRRIDP